MGPGTERTRAALAAGLLLACWLATGWTAAAEDPAEPAPELTVDEVIVVTATAREEPRLELPHWVAVLDAETLRSRRTVPQALSEVPGVMVQKTSHGQGSPYIRGFTGFRNLFLIDGIRLNNSVFREGPNPYWSTVDPFGLERLETVKGPVSVLYGSDAVGGTVQALTRSTLSRGETGRLYLRHATAERSAVGRLDLGGELGRWSYCLGATQKDFGDVEAGGEVGRQPHTGYRERDLDLKLRYALGGDTEVVAAFQEVVLDDAWRTHKTVFGSPWRGTAVGDEKRRVLDQRRTLGYLQLRRRRPGPLFDALTASLSFQRQEEERDRVRSDDRRDLQGFDVGTWGAWLRLEKASRFGHWTWGLESYRDGVDSFKHRFDAAGLLARRDVQGPVADDAAYQQWGAYVQNQIPVGGRLRLDLGARYTLAEADARAVADPRTGDRIAVAGRWNQLVGSARFSLALGAAGHTRLFGGVSQAFRAPNLSDLTRFDSARSNEIETPAPDLDEETFLSYELGLKWQAIQGSVELAAFHTAIDDLIVRTPTGVVIDGENEVTKRNGGDGFSRGLELSAEARLSDRISLFAAAAWVDGEVSTFQLPTAPAVREPLDRLAPATARLGARWRPRRGGWVEGLLTLAAAQDRLSSRDRADIQRIPPGGTPGYQVVTVRGGFELNHRWTLSAALENLFDVEYRIHGSGLNEPGRNLVIAVEVGF